MQRSRGEEDGMITSRVVSEDDETVDSISSNNQWATMIDR
jgi:hypothetical protein